MESLIKKIVDARNLIGATKMKKSGHNSYSKYDYFTPEQVEKLVSDACNEVGITFVFHLKADQFGMYGELQVFSVDGSPIITTEMRTAMPEIKATNAAQQMGGAMTYTRRYMLMSLFGITDNSLDFDSQDNRKQPAGKPKPTAAQFDALLKRKAAGTLNIDEVRNHFDLNEHQIKSLTV